MTDEVDEDARRRFEAAWTAGVRPAIDAFVPRDDDPRYLATLEELVHVELELAWRAARGGDGPRVEGFVERFPALAEPAITRRLVESEIEARCRAGDPPAADELARRWSWLGDAAALVARASARVAPGPGVALGRYRISGEHARGGFGMVWAAEDRELGRTVAIKQLDVRAATDPSLRERFLTEAKITARLDHPGIVPVYELRDVDGPHPHYAMKLVRGDTLTRRIVRHHAGGRDPRERERLIDAVLSLARTIAFAHDHGVIHRDLKPDNVVLGGFGEVFVLDWGLARMVDRAEPARPGAGIATAPAGATGEHTQAGTVLGTPAYMPPEQARGDEVDPRADVYAIGAVLYHVLAGDRPYAHAATSAQILTAVLDGEPRPLGDVAPDAPPELVSIVHKAMARAPAERYASATELASQLAHYREGRLVGAHAYRTRDLVARWVRRHRGVLLAVAAMLVVVIALGTLAIREVVHERDRARRNLDETIELMVADGRDELVAGRPWRAAPPLARAYRLGATDRVTRMLLADAMRSQDALVATLGELDEIAFATDGTRLAGTSRAGPLELWDLSAATPTAVATARLDGALLVSPVFAAGGSLVITSGDRVRVWDARDGSLVRTLDGDTAVVADATRILTSGAHGASLADLATSAPPRRFAEGERVHAARLVAGGTRVVTLGDRFAIWDAASGTLLAEKFGAIDPHGVFAISDELAAIAAEDVVQVWRLATPWVPRSETIPIRGATQVFPIDGGTVVVAARSGTLSWCSHVADGVWTTAATDVEPHRRRFDAAVTRTSSDVLAAVGLQDGGGAVYEVESRRLRSQLRAQGRLGCLGFARGGAEVLACRDDGTAVMVDVATGHALQTFAPRDRVDAIAADPTGAFVATTSKAGVARLWSTRHRKLRAAIAVEGQAPLLLAADPVRPRLAIAGSTRIVVWDVRAGARVADLELGSAIAGIAYSPDGTQLAAAHGLGVVDVWQGETLARRATLVRADHIPGPAHGDPVDDRMQVLAFSADGRWLASAHDGLDVWDARALHHEARLPGEGAEVGFSGDGARVGARMFDGTTRLWRTNGWQDVPGLPRTHDDQVIHTGIDRTVRLAHATGDVRAVAVGHRGTWVATGTGDPVARLWNARTGALVRTFSEHAGRVHRLALSREEQLLVTADAASTLRLWDAATGDLLAVLAGHRTQGSIVIAPDLSYLASAGDGVVHVWDLGGETRSAGEIERALPAR